MARTQQWVQRGRVCVDPFCVGLLQFPGLALHHRKPLLWFATDHLGIAMAAHDHNGEQPGTMDISEHVRTWKLFTGLVKWSMAGLALLMLVLLIFRTHG
jgi:hypothetical protein